MFFSLLYLLISLTRNSYSDVGPVSTIPVGAQWLLCLISPVALALAIDQVIFLAGFTSHISSCFQVLAIDQGSSSGVILVNIIINVEKLKTETIIGRNAQNIPFKLFEKVPQVSRRGRYLICIFPKWLHQKDQNHNFLTKRVRRMSNISTYTNFGVWNSFLCYFDKFEDD